MSLLNTAIPPGNSASLSQDIIQSICSHSDRPTLLSLSRTSRAFSLPALRKIWYSLTSFAPLFLTLPENALKRNEVKIGSPDYRPYEPSTTLIELTRELADEDIVRFRYYAPLVYEVAVASFPRYDVTLSAWQVLERANPGPLPNLRHVGVFVGPHLHEPISPPIYFLLGQGLRNVQLWMSFLESMSVKDRQPDTSFQKLLASLPHSSPQTSVLSLETLYLVPYARDALSQAVLGLSNLVHLSVIGIPLNCSALTHLCTLPRLQHLRFRAQSEDYPEGVVRQLPPGCNPLPLLEFLTIDSDSTRCATRLLPFLRPPELCSLDIKLSERPSASDLTTLSAAIATLPCKSFLRELVFDLPGNFFNVSVHSHATALPHAAFAPLQAIPNINTFRMHGNCYAAFDNRELAEMGSAWPDLRALVLCDQLAGPAGVTLTGLIDLAQRCKDLEELHVALADITRAECDAILSSAPLPAFDRATLEPVTKCGLWQLNVGRAAVKAEDVPAVAAVLSMVFPEVETAGHCWRPPYGEQNTGQTEEAVMFRRWHEVETAMPAFLSVREGEQRYAIKTLRAARSGL